jgi:hypothetical protein
MKRLLILFCVSAQALAQGTIFFNNRALYTPELGFYDALATYAEGTGLGSEMTAGLYVLEMNSVRLVASSLFRSNNSGVFNPEVVRIEGILPGEQARVQVRVWSTIAGSYESAVQNGLCAGVFPTISANNELLVTLTGNPGPGTAEISLDGLLPLTLDCIPEPNVAAIFLLGAVLLLRKAAGAM